MLSQGDGMAMFKDAKLIDAEGTLDIELHENYIVDHLGGTIGEEYAEPQGRITRKWVRLIFFRDLRTKKRACNPKIAGSVR